MTNDYHHGDLRRALIGAATAALRRSPPEEISLRALARQIGVSATAPYRHFPDRDSLLNSVAAEGYRRAASQLAGRTAEGVTAVAEVWSALAGENPGVAKIMTGFAGENRQEGELADSALEWLGQVVRAVEAEEEQDDPAIVVRRAISCWAAVHGLVSLRNSGVLESVDSWMVPRPAEMASWSPTG